MASVGKRKVAAYAGLLADELEVEADRGAH